jgi:hypothetical protein
MVAVSKIVTNSYTIPSLSKAFRPFAFDVAVVVHGTGSFLGDGVLLVP